MWAAEGRNAASLQAFFDQLTDEQKASIQAVSIDMSAGYEKAIRESIPDAEIVFDPFHVVKLGGEAADKVRRDEYNKHGRSCTDDRQVDQGRALQPAEGHRQPDRRSSCSSSPRS